jgi:hypothetical protein
LLGARMVQAVSLVRLAPTPDALTAAIRMLMLPMKGMQQRQQ